MTQPQLTAATLHANRLAAHADLIAHWDAAKQGPAYPYYSAEWQRRLSELNAVYLGARDRRYKEEFNGAR